MLPDLSAFVRAEGRMDSLCHPVYLGFRHIRERSFFMGGGGLVQIRKLLKSKLMSFRNRFQFLTRNRASLVPTMWMGDNESDTVLHLGKTVNDGHVY